MDIELQEKIKKRIKSKQKSPTGGELGYLELKRCAIVYKRLSSYEQVKESKFSMERLDHMEDIAIENGYKSNLDKDQINEIKEANSYSGYYQNGQIVVIELDLGHSGTKGQEERPGLAMMIDLIEQDLVESIYTIDVSRLFRDNKLISAPAFATLCKDHSVIIITEE